MVATIVLAIFAALAAWKWFTWRLCVSAMIYYIAKNDYTPPTKEDLSACTTEVVKHFLTKK